MTEENMLKSMVDSTGLNSEDVQNIIEMRNDLIDKLSEKVEESSEKFNKVRNEVIKVVPDIISHSEKLEHETEDGVSEMLKEAKGKLYDTANDVNCAFSGVINDLTMFSGESDQRASEILGDIKDRIERFSDDIGRTTFETDSGLEELEKIKGGTENVLDVTTKENELIGNVDEIVSEISVGFGEEAIRKGLEVVNKIYPFAKSAEGTVSETVDTCEKFDSEISEKTTVEVEEEGEKMGKLRKETFGNFQRLKEEVNNKVADVENSAGEKLQGFKEGIDEKINEINMVSDVKDIIYGLDDREKPIVGMSDVCAREDNEDLKEDKFSEEISAPAEVDFLSAANIDHLKSNTSNKDTKKVEEIASKSEDSKETQAIKTIIPPGKDVPKQVGILSESGVYYDDYDALKVKIEEIAITKQKDTVNDKADEVNKLFEEAHSISKKLKEWETGGDVADQQEMQRKEIHDITTDLNESSMAIGDSKSETQFTKNEERKLSSVSQQFPLISEHIKDEHNETTDRLQEVSEELVVSSANEIGPPLVQHSEITESLMVASERIEKQQSSEPTSELCFVAEKSFTANEKGTEHEIKLIAIAPQPETNVNLFTDQPSAAEDALKFSAAPTVLENALQSSIPTKSNDQDEIVTGAVIDHIQEKTESKHEVSYNISSQLNLQQSYGCFI